jgi:hypothetical protein
MKNEMIPLGTPGLRLPLQVAPVERTLAASSSSLSGIGGVEASGFNWGGLAQGILSALPGIISMF